MTLSLKIRVKDNDDSVFTAHNESSTVSSVHDESGTAERSESDDSDDEEESDVNLTDVLGDIDELIVEAEKAMKDEKQKGSQKPVEPVIQQQVETVTQSKPHSPSEVRAVPNERPPRPEPSSAPQPQKPVAAERRGPPPQQQTRPPPQPSRPAPPQQTQPPPQQSRPRTRSAQRVVRDEQIREQQHQQRTDASRRTKSVNAERIQRLTSEVSTHQSVINQTSQALSLIAANESLRNTLEEIEAEKMMVISNQKRQACLSEIQFLKNGPPVEESYAGDGSPAPKGHITINNIRLPFKTEYIMDLQSNKEMPSHYYFLVTRCGAQVTATNLLNTRENLTGDCLQFSTEVEISSLESDFSIEMLVYQLRSTVTRIEGMAERAVHPVAQTKTSRFGSLTPKKLRKTASKQQRSSVSSMGGSQPVRSCTFAVAGSARLTLASCGTTKFMLSRVPLTSPLEGSIHLCMGCRKNSSIALNGFLTMFDEISGFGSWHRRWCTLAEGYITFWKYPDDEKKKPPIGSIDLRECITKEVAQISRILCARPNTFELVTTRPASRYDKETLVSSCNNSVLTTKYMISADVKEERMEWIDALNRTLVDLRLWNKDAALPTE